MQSVSLKSAKDRGVPFRLFQKHGRRSSVMGTSARMATPTSCPKKRRSFSSEYAIGPGYRIYLPCTGNEGEAIKEVNLSLMAVKN